MYCIVLPGPTRDRNPLHGGLLGPPSSQLQGAPRAGVCLHSTPQGPDRSRPGNLELDLQVSCAQRHRSTAQGTAQRRERRGWCGTWDERMTWGNTMTKAKTAPMRFQDVSTKPDEGEREAPLQQDEPRRNQTKVTTKAKMKPLKGESRRRKTKTKTETRRRRRIPEKPDACLPQANQIRRESRRRCQILRRRIPRNRRRNPATTGTLFRSHLVWALHPGAGLRAGRSTPLVNVVLRRGIQCAKIRKQYVIIALA